MLAVFGILILVMTTIVRIKIKMTKRKYTRKIKATVIDTVPANDHNTLAPSEHESFLLFEYVVTGAIYRVKTHQSFYSYQFHEDGYTDYIWVDPSNPEDYYWPAEHSEYLVDIIFRFSLIITIIGIILELVPIMIG